MAVYYSFFRGAHYKKYAKIFWQIFKEMKKRITKDVISAGIFANLCCNSMNKHYFLSVAKVPRTPEGRYPEMSIFWLMFKEKKKRIAKDVF